MDEDDFNMPSHPGLLNKKLQIQALHQVREEVVKSFKALNDKEKRMRRLMVTSSSNRGCMILQESTERNQQQYNGSVEGYINYTSSQAESTLSHYNGGGGNNNQPDPNNLPWRLGQDEKKHNPAGRYPFGFKYCFKCGSSDHYKREDCPLGSVKDRNVLDIFFKEFNIHKPNY